MITDSQADLTGTRYGAEKLKKKVEAIDTRVTEVTTLQGLEARLGELWEIAKGLEGTAAEQKEVESLKDALGTLRIQLWTATRPEDLATAAGEVQKAKQQAALLLVKVSDEGTLGFAAEQAALGSAFAVESPPAPASPEEDGPSEQDSLRAAAMAVAAPSPAATAITTPSVRPTPKADLDKGQTDRRLARARLGQGALIVLAAAVAVSSGMQALYVDKAWGDSFWDWLAIFVWGAAAQTTVSALGSALDGLRSLVPGGGRNPLR